MKTIIILIISGFAFSCAKSNGDSNTNAQIWNYPTTTQETYQELLGKTFNGNGGNVFRFKMDGSVEAQFTGLSETNLNTALGFQKVFTCRMTASSYSVTTLNGPTGHGSFLIQFNNATETRIGVDISAAWVQGCYRGGTGILAFYKSNESDLVFYISNFSFRNTPSNAGYYEGNGREIYIKP